MTVRPTWDLDIGGLRHRVELAPFDPLSGPPGRFRYDRVEGQLYARSPWTWIKWLILDRPTLGVARFTIGGQPASLALIRRTPSYGLAVRAAFGSSLRALPEIILHG